MKRIITLLIFLPGIGLAQTQSKSSLIELQQSTQQHANRNIQQQSKGWKWMKRYEQELSTRTSLSGTLPDQYTYVKELQKIDYKPQSTGHKQSGWAPFGPENLPPSVESVTSHGMGRINCIAFHPTDSAIIYVGVAQGGVWKSVNSGQSWTPLTDQLPITRISDIAIDPTNPNTIYISVGDYAYLGVALKTDGRKRHTHYGIGVYKTIDGGMTWNPTGLSLEQDNLDASLIRRVIINKYNPQELIAAGIEGIFKSYDGGASWIKKSSEIIWDIERANDNSTNIYASTAFVNSLQQGSASIIYSNNFGESWSLLNTGIPAQTVQRAEIAISHADSNRVYVVTCGLDRGLEGFYASTNHGVTWSKKYDGANSPNILGWGNTVGGGGQGTYDLAIVTDRDNADGVYVGGINLWGSNDGGATFNGMSYWLPYYGEYLHADQHQYAYNPLNRAYYFANDGGLYRADTLIIGNWTTAENDPNYKWPTKFKFLSNGLQITSFYRLGLRKRYGDVIAGAQDNSTFYRTDTGWVNMIGGDGMECILHPTDPLTLYGSAQFGYIVQSFDGGISFNFIGPSTGENSEWTTPFQLAKNNPDHIYMGFENMHKSTDEGISFTQISNFPTMINGLGAVISTFDIADGNENYIYVAKRINHQNNEPMRFYVSTNGGQSWINRTSGLPDSLYCTYVSVDHENPNVAWACFSGFAAGVKVFKTSNAGQTWTNISENLPNIPMNCIINQAGTALNTVYLGTDAGVYYTYDGANTWFRYSDNLPNVIISELEIHEDSAKLFAASFGRGIWVTDLVNAAVGLEQKGLEQTELLVFPNKNDGKFNLQIESITAKQIKIQILDISGKIVYEESVQCKTDSLKKKFDLEILPGMYFIRINNGLQSKSVKFLVE